MPRPQHPRKGIGPPHAKHSLLLLASPSSSSSLEAAPPASTSMGAIGRPTGGLTLYAVVASSLSDAAANIIAKHTEDVKALPAKSDKRACGKLFKSPRSSSKIPCNASFSWPKMNLCRTVCHSNDGGRTHVA
mmetsp:Transcript_3343/g.5573  ORF Transcript_3343/g.5573 Transcript_3343/m.5573 type:complete len:132 (-) Transcript_3343:29-424(-)